MKPGSSFESALKFTLQWEGGYSNHPADKGGETNFGITHAVYNSYCKSKGLTPKSVRLISQTEVSEIYYKNYWLTAGCELLPAKLALFHFDWAVNAGVKRAIQTLQQTVGTPSDGVIGAKTRAAVINSVNSLGEKAICLKYCGVRESYYRRWGAGSQRVFLNGWLNRLAALKREIA